MSKLERLMNLTAELLKASQPISAETIHRRVDGYPEGDIAFHRAFERDKDDLRELGVPLIVAPVPDADPPLDGYMIDEGDYFLPDPGLDPEELGAIALAAQMVQFDQDSASAALWKLGGFESGVDPAPIAAIATDPKLDDLFEAIRERRLVEFTYNDAQRSVEPIRLAHGRGRWYLIAFDRTREAERRFRVDRITGPLTASEPEAYTPRSADASLDREPWEFLNTEPVQARVRIDAERAPQALRRIRPGTPITHEDGGSVVLQLDVNNVAAFRSFVLDFRHYAEVLDPPELRADMVEWLQAIVEGGGR